MNLRQKTFSAGRWTAVSALVRVTFQVLQTVVLARILVPADFGLMAVTAALLAVIALFSDFGLSRAIIHYGTISKSALSSLYWINLAMGASLTVALAVGATALAAMFRQPSLSTVLLSASPIFLLTSIGQQFCVLAEKELRFSVLAINEIIGAFAGLAVAITVAVCGGGVYSLIGGILTTTGVVSLLAWSRLSAEYRPNLHFELGEARPFLRFGAYLVGENFASTLTRQADVFVGGLIAGPNALGIYSLSRDLSLRLGMAVNPVITRVGFPVMARIQGDVAALRAVYLQTLRITSSINFPVYVAVGLFAHEIVAVLYGPRWEGAGKYLQVLSAWGLIRSVGNPVGGLLYAVGSARLAFWWNIALLIVFPPALLIGAQFGGLYGLAWTMLGLQLLIFAPIWRCLVFPACGASFRDYCQSISPPLVSAMIAGVVAYAVAAQFSSPWLRLGAGGCVGLLSYGVFSLWLNRDSVRVLRTLFKLDNENGHGPLPAILGDPNDK